MWSQAVRRAAGPAFHAARQTAARAVPTFVPGLKSAAFASAGAAAATVGFLAARPQPAACDDKKSIDWAAVRKAVVEVLEKEDYADSSYAGANPGPFFLRLAWHSSGTFCKHSNTGGSDAASMRFEPEISWGANAGLGKAQALLEPVKQKFPDVSYADLWIFAATVAVEEMGGPKIPFISGRTDAKNGSECPVWEGPTHKDGRLPGADMGSPDKTAAHLRYIFNRMGFDDREIVALSGAHGLGACHTDRSGYWGPWTRAPTTVSNEYFRELLENTWTVKTEHKGKPWTGPLQFEDPTGELMMLPSDIVLTQDKEFRKYVALYAKDQDAFLKDFGAVCGKLFNGGVGCKGGSSGGVCSTGGVCSWFSQGR